MRVGGEDEELQERSCLHWSQAHLPSLCLSQRYLPGSFIVFTSFPFRWSIWHAHLLLSTKQ